MELDDLRELIRTIPDFPKRGVQFRDITTLIGDADGFAACLDHLAEALGQTGAGTIAGIEARGFIFGAALAARTGLRFIPVRKQGKLPVATLGVDYALEYGTDRVEIDPAQLSQGERVAIVDDLIATGGTALAATRLVREAGGEVNDALFAIDLIDLGGARKLREAGVDVFSLFEFEGE